jgi:hypothetical protein
MQASIIVKISPVLDSRKYPPSSAECDHVRAAPEVSSRAVFRRGISQGFLTSIPFGGQTAPIDGVGFRLA